MGGKERYVPKGEGVWGGQKMVGPLELRQAAVNWLTWVLGIELGSSATVVGTFNYWGTSLAPTSPFIFETLLYVCAWCIYVCRCTL